ncbi:NAD(P)H-dependent oxidoreductase [uncultured Aquitalea sp.]|uniref:flavodoxin family protein n=1 Tax=uncultured Aquitalea sp. TaxID=540272 RepID=UPI0025FB3070|nr:NAD(P)H-dependent oxidoreductase [uncultured Aquitalea sp.]
MKRVLVVHATQTGRTLQLVDALLQGLAEAGDEVVAECLCGLDAGPEAVLRADALVIATPENFGYMAGGIKDFLDRSFYPLEERTAGLPWLMLVSAGTDGEGAARSVERIVGGLAWRRVMPALLCRGEPDAQMLAQARERGEVLVAGLLSGMW